MYFVVISYTYLHNNIIGTNIHNIANLFVMSKKTKFGDTFQSILPANTAFRISITIEIKFIKFKFEFSQRKSQIYRYLLYI